MQTTAIMTDINLDLKTRKPKISLLLDTKDINVIEQLKSEEKLNIELKKYRKKRSLDANAYCWVLCDKIAKELCKDGTVITKEKIYQDMILQIGTFQPLIIEERAYENFKRIWEKQGLGFLIQEVSRKDKCVKVHCYYGSSRYPQDKMNVLLDEAVQEAKSLGIETLTPKELSRLKEEWK